MRQDDKEDIEAIIQRLLTLAKADKMRQFYGAIEPDDEHIIRTSFNPAGTDTGRFSSSGTFLEKSLNLQNLPKTQAKRDPLFEVREVLGPHDGKAWLSVDFSSAERRLLAYLADESRAIEQIESDVDAYRWFAAKLFDDVDHWQEIERGSSRRQIGKMIVLALDRGVGWKKLKDSVNKDAELTGATISAQTAKEAVELFHNLYPGYKRFFDRVEQTLRDKGFLVNCMGRKRIFFGRRSRMDSLVREGVSFLAQAVGDILNARLIDIYEELDPEDLQILLQVHDEIDMQCPPGDVNRLKNRLLEIMQKPVDLTRSTPRPTTEEVVIPSDVAVSTSSWGESEEIT